VKRIILDTDVGTDADGLQPDAVELLHFHDCIA
jgi:hypothetical protein